MADRFDEMAKAFEIQYNEKRYLWDINKLHVFPDMAKELAAYLRAEFGKEWIPVLKRHPTDYQGKIYHTMGYEWGNEQGKSFYNICAYNGDKFYSIEQGYMGTNYPYVSYWCETELPEPPKESKQNE